MAGIAETLAALLLAGFAGLSAANAQDGATLQKIKASGAIAIGYRDTAIPFTYPGAEQKPAGFLLDLCSLAAEKAKQKLGLTEIKIDYKLVTPANRSALLKDGSVDIDCSPVPQTQELAREVAFSMPVYASQLRWIVLRQIRVDNEGGRRRYGIKTLSSTADLKDLTVALTKDSPAASAVLSLSVDRFLGLSIIQGKDAADAFKLVETGKAAAFMDDDVQLVSLKANAKNPDLFGFLDENFPGPAYAFAMRKDDEPFKDLVDDALADAMKSGDYEKLYSKWFENPIPPKNINLAYPMSVKLKELIKTVAAN